MLVKTVVTRILAKSLTPCSPNSYPNLKYIPLKCLKILVFCRNNGLGTYNYKICAESSTGNFPNTPQFILPVFPNLPIIWDILKKALITCPLSMALTIIIKLSYVI